MFSTLMRLVPRRGIADLPLSPAALVGCNPQDEIERGRQQDIPFEVTKISTEIRIPPESNMEPKKLALHSSFHLTIVAILFSGAFCSHFGFRAWKGASGRRTC